MHNATDAPANHSPIVGNDLAHGLHAGVTHGRLVAHSIAVDAQLSA
jgi:hypothetical protein